MIRPLALLLTALPLVLNAGNSAAAEAQATVPARFQGDWQADVKQCGKGTDDSHLTIEAGTIRFYENEGAIKAAVTEGDTDLALITELSGEGEKWLAVNMFRLSDDHQSLSDITGDTELVRHRCPQKAK